MRLKVARASQFYISLVALSLASSARSRTAFAQSGTWSVSGQVLDSRTSEPLKAMTIDLSRLSDHQLVASAKTDSEGRFLFTGNGTGTFGLMISNEFGPMVSDHPTLDLDPDSVPSSLLLRAVNSRIVGQVIDSESGLPLAACRLGLLGNRLAHGRLATLELENTSTKEDGSFAFSGMPTGEYKVEISCTRKSGTGTLIFFYPHATDLESAAPIYVQSGDDNKLYIEAVWPTRTATVVGKIAAPSGVSALQVAAYPLGAITPTSIGGFPCFRSGSRAYSCADIPFGRYTLTVAAFDDDGPQYSSTFILVTREKVEAPALPLFSRKLDVTVSQELSNDFGDVTLGTNLKLQLEPIDRPWMSDVAPCEGGHCHPVLTSGRYFVDVLAKDTHVYISALYLNGVSVPPMQAVQLNTGLLDQHLAVTLKADGGTVTGFVSVLDPDLSLPRFIQLRSKDTGGANSFTRILVTDTAGFFRFDSVPPGDYQLDQSSTTSEDPSSTFRITGKLLDSFSLSARGVYDRRR